MKRSEAARLIDGAVTLDQVRQKLAASNMQNFYQELEMDSSTVDAHRDISCNANHVQQHSHLFYELIFCSSGQPNYLLAEEKFSIQPGDIIVVPPGVAHQPLLSQAMDKPYERYVLWVSETFMHSSRVPQGPLPTEQTLLVLRTEGTAWSYLKRYFTNCVQEAEQQALGWQLCIEACTSQLLVQLARAANELGALHTTTGNSLQEQILRYIQAHLSEPISLSHTAQKFHISESTLTHLFHREVGISFYRCVTLRRLIRAKSLIAQELPLEQISQQVGFSDYSSFYRAFKSEYGISPAQFRRIASGR